MDTADRQQGVEVGATLVAPPDDVMQFAMVACERGEDVGGVEGLVEEELGDGVSGEIALFLDRILRTLVGH